MKECQIHQNSKLYKICSICNKAILDINLNFIHNLRQIEKIKENLKYIQPSEFIKICNCKNLKKDINNDNNLYAHKYCILLKIIYLLEIKCEKCNTAYNIKVNKKIDLKKKLYLYVVFLLIYIIHLLIYFFGIVMLFVDAIFKKFSKIKKYYYIIYFFIIILLIINSLLLYFSIINNIVYYKYIFNYTINVLDTSKIEITNKYYELISDYFKWFYRKSQLLLLIYKHKNYIINKSINISNKEINIYIKENNKENKILKNTFDKISQNSNKNKISLNINSNNINNTNNSNILILQNAPNHADNENEFQNPFDKFILNKKEEIKIENNINTNNDLLDLYSNKSDNNNEDNENNNNEKNVKKNLIDMTSINKFNKDYINININPIQANNINININFNDLNKVKDISYINEKNELSFHPSKLHDSTGKTALIPNKNLMNKIMDDNIYKNYLKQRRQIKSIKLKQKDIKIKDTKIIGNIEENEEIDFSEFEKGKMDSKISKNTKGDKLYFLKSIVEEKDLFTTKKSYKDVPLNISNPTDSVLYDDRFSLKNNIVSKNVNYSNSNLLHYIKK